jgi:fumarylpyruvate hydrolase
MSKGFDQSAPVGTLVSATDWQPASDSGIRLAVDGRQQQNARLGDMLWSVSELLSQLSKIVTLGAGDAVFTGTPAGVSAIVPGQEVRASISGLPDLVFTILTPSASDAGVDSHSP